MVRSNINNKSIGIKSILLAFLIIAMIMFTSCGKNASDSITREDYDKMMEIVSLNDDFDLIDVRSALYSFVPKFVNAESYTDIEDSIKYIEKYSTSLLQSSLKTSSYTARAEYRNVENIYYCYPENSSDGKGKFLAVLSMVGEDGQFIDNTRTYMLFTLSSDGKLTQIERW